MRVHLIDDDKNFYSVLKDNFGNLFDLSVSYDQKEASVFLNKNFVDIVILDMTLPGTDGFEFYKKLRKEYPLMPFIFITEKKDDYDKILGLELGAEDYLYKPLNPRELSARIKAIMRRLKVKVVTNKSTNVLFSKTWNIKMDLDSRDVTCNDKNLSLTLTEFELLKYLMINTGITQTRDSLINKLKKFDGNVTARVIDVHIGRLRQKLGNSSKTEGIIKTVWGTGYSFSA